MLELRYQWLAAHITSESRIKSHSYTKQYELSQPTPCRYHVACIMYAQRQLAYHCYTTCVRSSTIGRTAKFPPLHHTAPDGHLSVDDIIPCKPLLIPPASHLTALGRRKFAAYCLPMSVLGSRESSSFLPFSANRQSMTGAVASSI